MQTETTPLDRIIASLEKENLEIASISSRFPDYGSQALHIHSLTSYELTKVDPMIVYSFIGITGEAITQYFENNEMNQKPMLTGGDNVAMQYGNEIFVLQHLGDESYLFTAIDNHEQSQVDSLGTFSVNFTDWLPSGKLANSMDPDLLAMNDPHGNFTPIEDLLDLQIIKKGGYDSLKALLTYKALTDYMVVDREM